MDETQRAKKREYMRRYRERHPELREYHKRYNDQYFAKPENQQKARERAREWYWSNRERASERAKQRYEETKQLKGRPTGENHVNWKGERVGYHALHVWLQRVLGTPSECEHCGTTTAKRFEWANIDHKYRRVLTDYVRLCTSCHRRYDYENGLAKKGGRKRHSE